MVTIKDIAKVTGYSITAVSKALSDAPDISQAAKKRIREVAEEMQFVPNAFGRSLASKKSYTIGIIYEERSDLGLSHPFFGSLLTRLKAKVEEHGYDMLLIGKKIGQYVGSYIAHCMQKGVDGVIVLSNIVDKVEYEKIVSTKIPMVFVDYYCDLKHSVYTNNELAINQIMQHLHDFGHKRIAFLGGDFKYTSGVERYNAYKDALTRYDLPFDQEIVLYAYKYKLEEGYLQTKKLLENKNVPTAILCTGDMLALGALRAIKEANLNVPKDISIVGFDNIIITELTTPPITTYAQNIESLAENTVKLLFSEMEKDNLSPQKVLVQGNLIQRESVTFAK